MASLTDRLKALGVKVGTSDLPAPAPKTESSTPIEETLDGRWLDTQRGRVLVCDHFYPLEHRHGEMPLFMPAPLHHLAHWARDARLREMPIEKFAFLDTETSGLAGGTGTYAFLVGVGRFVGADQGFLLRQFFMSGPGEEAAVLEALIDFLAPCAALVTFNGKSFDAPLLNTRYALHATPSPLKELVHVDLLPLARRLWRDRLPSRALKYLEEHIMLAPRTSEEVPGYEIPFMYFDYLRTGDAAPLKGVFYHNAMDIVAMTALFTHTVALLADPHSANLEHGLDVTALARLFEDIGKWEDAARLYERGLELGLPEAGFADAMERYSALQRRRGDVDAAVKLWQRAAGEGHIYAHVELSKHYEHRKRDYSEAYRWAKSALQLAQAPSLPASIRRFWTDEISRRLARLIKKFNHENGEPL